MTGQFVHHPGLDRLSFYRAQFYPEKRYVLNYLHDSAATGIWELYQWQTDGELKMLSEAAIQFEGDALTAMAGREKKRHDQNRLYQRTVCLRGRGAMAFGTRQADDHIV